MGEDAPSDEGIVDGGDEVHAAVTARAIEDVEAEGAAEQGGPLESSRACGLFGAERAERMDRQRRRRRWRQGR
jgi:hypothetical protein